MKRRNGKQPSDQVGTDFAYAWLFHAGYDENFLLVYASEKACK